MYEKEFPSLPEIRYAEGELTDCALLLEGGSFRGIYSAGVCDVLMENGIHPTAVAGVSVGALCGWNVMARQIGRFARICILHRDDSRYAGWKAFLSDGGFIGFDFILRIADELYPVPFGTREDPRRRFVAVSTDLQTGKPFYAEYGVHSPFRGAIKASASLAFSSRIVKMRGKELLDGGYSAAFPLEWAEENGYRKKIAILTQPIEARKEPVDRKKKKLFAACYSSYPAFLQTVEKVPAMYNAQREKLASMAERGQAFVIAPRAEIPLGKMESNTQKLYLYYLHGRRDALQALDALKEYLEK